MNDITIKKERLHWADIAKGILAILVVVSHLHTATPGDDGAKNLLVSSHPFYVSWFMAAFFVITGFCSNFSKPLKIFIKDGFRTLIIPGVLILLIARALTFLPISLLHGRLNSLSIKYLAFDVVLYGGSAWFVGALFTCKLICRGVLLKIQSLPIQLFVVSAIGLLGLYVHNANLKIFEFWRISYGMLFLPYMWGGVILKRYKLANYLGIVSVVISIVILVISAYIDPSIIMTKTIQCNFSQVPTLIAQSGAGICLVFSMAILLKQNKFLEYIGRISLIVYLMQWSVMCNFIPRSHLFGHCLVLSILGYILTVILVLLFAMIVQKVCIKYKKLNFIIGK